jgi:hypothetical protein
MLYRAPYMLLPAFNTEGFLASPAELVGLLAHFADSNRRHSTQRRRDRELAQEALATLLPAMTLVEEAMPLAIAEPAASIPPTDRASASGRAPAVAGLSRVQRRQYCQCGNCKWCLDNARWERVFNEKFLDPMYYGRLTVRHNSTLAGAR